MVKSNYFSLNANGKKNQNQVLSLNISLNYYQPQPRTILNDDKHINDQSRTSKPELVLHEDYYINDLGQWVFTAAYHLKRGYCCANGCKHCPYTNKDES